MRRLLPILLLAACATDGDEAPLDPSGNYTLAITWSTGNCGQTGTTNFTFRVADQQIVTDMADVMIKRGTDRVECVADECRIPIDIVWDLANSSGYLRIATSLALTADGRLTGSGTVRRMTSATALCSQLGAFGGSRR